MFGSIKDEAKKVNVQGVGLGLVICKLIVEKFEGNIDFISKYKKGSTFFFTFKLEETDEIVEEQGQACGCVPIDHKSIKIMSESKITSLSDLIFELKGFSKYSQRRILVIDDEEFCISSMKAIMFTLGLDIER